MFKFFKDKWDDFTDWIDDTFLDGWYDDNPDDETKLEGIRDDKNPDKESLKDTGEYANAGSGYSSAQGQDLTEEQWKTDALATGANVGAGAISEIAKGLGITGTANAASTGANVANTAATASTIGDILTAIQVGSSIAGAIDYNDTLRATNKETNQTNMAIANQNLGFQRENLDYQKALQQQIFNREDNSYARTVADMRQSGISPLAMNGTNGAGEAIATTPMNNSYQHTPLSDYKSPFDALTGLTSLVAQQEQLRGLRLQNDEYEQTTNTRRAIQRAELLSRQYENLDKGRKEAFNKQFGINSSMSEKERLAAIISKIIGTPLFKSDGSASVASSEDLDKVFNKISSLSSSYIDKAIEYLDKKFPSKGSASSTPYTSSSHSAPSSSVGKGNHSVSRPKDMDDARAEGRRKMAQKAAKRKISTGQ